MEPVPPCSINEIFENIQEGKLDRNEMNNLAQIFNKLDLNQEQKVDQNKKCRKVSRVSRNVEEEMDLLGMDVTTD